MSNSFDTSETGAAFLHPILPDLAAIHHVLPILRRAPLFDGIESRQLEMIAATMRLVRYAAGQTICRQGDRADHLYLVAQGRVQLSAAGRLDNYRLLDYASRGEHFGEMALLTDGRLTTTVLAVTDCELLLLDREPFQRCLATLPLFGANISRALGFQLRWQTSGRPRRWQPKLIGLVHSTLQTQRLICPLAEALSASGETVRILTERPGLPAADGLYRIEQVSPAIQGTQRVEHFARRMHRLAEPNARVLVDVRQEPADPQLARLLLECDEIFWLAEPSYAEEATASLNRVLSTEPRLALRTHWVWILKDDHFAPRLPEEPKLAPRDFKIVVGEGSRQAVRLQRGISALARHLKRRSIGLALGGGGARGLAHLGALQAFDEAGIFFDSLAGTSCGALMGAAYAAGWEPQQAAQHFQDELTPKHYWRWLPRAKHWYLWAMFHMRAWDGMLRRHMGDHCLEQLQIPLATVTVDLISGREVVRDTGDIVHAVLESINIPIVAPPLLRDGMILVDGGILNNLPGDVLARRGADLVIGVDVSARLAPRFAGNRAGMATSAMRRPGPIETLLRVNEVQDSGLSTLRNSALDLVITPETADFEFADFTKAFALAERGFAAAQEVIPQVRQLITDLEAA